MLQTRAEGPLIQEAGSRGFTGRICQAWRQSLESTQSVSFSNILSSDELPLRKKAHGR